MRRFRTRLLSPRITLWTVCWAALLAGSCAHAATGVPQSQRDVLRHDAALRDVAFVDPQHGWAVGDRGVIWRTRDGGKHWHQAASPVDCQLHEICFADPQQGWIVGGLTQPYLHTTRGVVLATSDGGQSWRPMARALVPMLYGATFFDARRGAAWGSGCFFYPAGLHTTDDGGKSWQPLPEVDEGNWQAASLSDAGNGLLLGADGRLVRLADGKLVSVSLDVAGDRRPRAVAISAPSTAWVVGEGGLILKSDDAGQTWAPPARLPGAGSANIDFETLVVRGPKIWIAGSPGTRIVHSPDGGQSWRATSTGGRAPLYGMTFIDDQHGWAVGALGTIVATTNGGKSWRVQRSGGERAALLAVFARPADVPFELLAEYAAAEGYLTSVVIPFADRTAAAGGILTSDVTQRTHEALLAVGATSARIGLPAGLGPSQPADASPPDSTPLEQHLLRQLRQWRPDVVVTHHPTTPDPLARQLAESLLKAVERVAASPVEVAIAEEVGQAAYRVRRVFGVLPPGGRGEVVIHTEQFAPRVGHTLGDWAAAGRALVVDEFSAGPDEVHLATIGASGGRLAERTLFSGQYIPPASGARRPLATPSMEDLDQWRRLSRKRPDVSRLIEEEIDETWSTRAVNLTGGLDAERGGLLLMRVADAYRRAGKWDLAADTYYLLLRRYPDHPLTDHLLTWLVEYYASGEIAHQRRASATRSPGGVQLAAAIEPSAQARPGSLSNEQRRHRAQLLGDYLEDSRPLLFAEPRVRLPLSVVRREQGAADEALPYFSSLNRLRHQPRWSRRAQFELLLARARDPAEVAIARCAQTAERPHLDGRLDDACWQGDKSLIAGSLDQRGESPPTSPRDLRCEVRMACDADHLYLAVRCRKQAGLVYERDDRPRPRDADLTEFDRVLLRLDVDRDYLTAYELAIDHRGWTHDACWGDASWDPTWYVAASEDEQTWTTEIALAWSEIATESPPAGTVWAAAVERQLPENHAQDMAVRRDASADFLPVRFE